MTIPTEPPNTKVHLQTLEQCYQSHRNELIAYVVKNFRFSKACAEDIVQAAYIKMTQSDTDIQSTKLYIYRVTHNLCIDYTRKEKTQTGITQHVEFHGETQNDLCPERTVSARQLLTILNNVIWKMPEKRRKLFAMHRFQGLGFTEIGRRTGLSESAVRKHVAKALAECQKAAENYND